MISVQPGEIKNYCEGKFGGAPRGIPGEKDNGKGKKKRGEIFVSLVALSNGVESWWNGSSLKWWRRKRFCKLIQAFLHRLWNLIRIPLENLRSQSSRHIQNTHTSWRQIMRALFHLPSQKEENKQKHKKDEIWWVAKGMRRLTRPSILLQTMLKKQQKINNSQKTLDTFLMMERISGVWEGRGRTREMKNILCLQKHNNTITWYFEREGIENHPRERKRKKH